MLPVYRGGSIRKAADTSRVIVLVVIAQRKELPVCEVGIKSGDDGVLSNRGAGVETKATRIQAVADGRVIRVIAGGSPSEDVEGSRICAWINSIRGKIGGTYLRSG